MSGRISWHAAVVAVIALGYCGFGLFVGGGYDPGRDVAEAFAIAHDGARPLLGPVFAGHVRFGPLWFWLMALPMFVFPTWLTAAMTAVIIGALQFPLAYATGKRLAGPQLGVLWAAALAMPGWASFETVGFTSTNAMRTGVIATLYCVLRTRDTPHLGWWIAAGLAAAAATHAHPSCAWGFLCVVFAAWRAPGRLVAHVDDRIAAWLAAGIGFALLFTPALFAVTSMIGSTRAVAESNIALANLARLPQLLRSIVWTGPHAIMSAVFAYDAAWPRIVATLSAALAIVGALRGMFAAFDNDIAARWGLALTALALTFVALIRPVTPLYMAYSILPPYALLVAAGWNAFARRHGALFVLPALAAAAVAGAGVVRSMQHGGGRIDTPLIADIVHSPSTLPVATDIWLPAYSVDRLGRTLCADPSPVYAALPYALDVFYAMPLRMHCATAIARFTDEAAGGSARGRLGLARQRYRELGIEPATVVGGLGMSPVDRVVAAPTHRDLPLSTLYPPHTYVQGKPQKVEYAFDAPGADLVVVANPLVTWMPDWWVQVTCDGAGVVAATQDLVTQVYACASAQPVHHWTIATTAADPHALEIVTFAPRMR